MSRLLIGAALLVGIMTGGIMTGGIMTGGIMTGGIMTGGMAVPAAAIQDASPPASPVARPACAASPAGTPAAPAEATLAEWQTLGLTDARTGDEFTVAELLGCTVYVETMATWCGECRHQLENVASAAESLDRERFVFVAISVETDLAPEELATYANEAEFDWLFAVATPDVLRAIVDEFGRGAIVPPSTPHVIVGPDGTYGELRTGYTEPGEIVGLMTEAAEG